MHGWTGDCHGLTFLTVHSDDVVTSRILIQLHTNTPNYSMKFRFPGQNRDNGVEVKPTCYWCLRQLAAKQPWGRPALAGTAGYRSGLAHTHPAANRLTSFKPGAAREYPAARVQAIDTACPMCHSRCSLTPSSPAWRSDFPGCDWLMNRHCAARVSRQTAMPRPRLEDMVQPATSCRSKCKAPLR